MDTFAIAELWAELVAGLGYQRFAVQGGDWGASVASCLGFLFPDRVIGVHLNRIPGSFQPPQDSGAQDLSAEERAFVAARDSWFETEGGYFRIQATKPQSLAYALNDSSVGLAAWIVEKFRTWSDCEGDLERVFTKDELLTNISLYWFTHSMPSAMRLYWENRRRPLRFAPGERVRVPCAVALFPKEIVMPPRSWVERVYNVQRWTHIPKGGHFAAFEQPELLVQDVRAFFRSLQSTEVQAARAT
jgi:pimeloyl-ACP methyl ester carboxylesterase